MYITVPWTLSAIFRSLSLCNSAKDFSVLGWLVLLNITTEVSRCKNVYFAVGGKH